MTFLGFLKTPLLGTQSGQNEPFGDTIFSKIRIFLDLTPTSSFIQICRTKLCDLAHFFPFAPIIATDTFQNS